MVLDVLKRTLSFVSRVNLPVVVPPPPPREFLQRHMFGNGGMACCERDVQALGGSRVTPGHIPGRREWGRE